MTDRQTNTNNVGPMKIIAFEEHFKLPSIHQANKKANENTGHLGVGRIRTFFPVFSSTTGSYNRGSASMTFPGTPRISVR
jgi:hypothetical protein